MTASSSSSSSSSRVRNIDYDSIHDNNHDEKHIDNLINTVVTNSSVAKDFVEDITPSYSELDAQPPFTTFRAFKQVGKPCSYTMERPAYVITIEVNYERTEEDLIIRISGRVLNDHFNNGKKFKKKMIDYSTMAGNPYKFITTKENRFVECMNPECKYKNKVRRGLTISRWIAPEITTKIELCYTCLINLCNDTYTLIKKEKLSK
jgi:hypothetical protein